MEQILHSSILVVAGQESILSPEASLIAWQDERFAELLGLILNGSESCLYCSHITQRVVRGVCQPSYRSFDSKAEYRGSLQTASEFNMKPTERATVSISSFDIKPCFFFFKNNVGLCVKIFKFGSWSSGVVQ